VAIVEWVDPPFTAGHWVPDLVHAAGGTPVAARLGAHSVQTTWTEFTAAAPDLVMVTPYGFHLDGAVDPARAVARHFPGIPVWAIAAILHPGAVPEPPAGAIQLVS